MLLGCNGLTCLSCFQVFDASFGRSSPLSCNNVSQWGVFPSQGTEVEFRSSQKGQASAVEQRTQLLSGFRVRWSSSFGCQAKAWVANPRAAKQNIEVSRTQQNSKKTVFLPNNPPNKKNTHRFFGGFLFILAFPLPFWSPHPTCQAQLSSPLQGGHGRQVTPGAQTTQDQPWRSRWVWILLMF